MSNYRIWSELNSDVLKLILERLDIISNLRARCVCKNWYRVCKQISSVQDTFPWVIIFPPKRPKSNSCHLFNPQENKFYKLSNLGKDFSANRCIATSGSWLLMLDIRSSLYVLNLFTRETIDLPPLESHQGRLRVMRFEDNTFSFLINQSYSYIDATKALSQTKAVLWVDEKTKDYIVVWSIGLFYIMFTRRGNDSWREIPTREGPESLHGCQDLVYKENKLYVLTCQNQIRILNFSQELPRAIPENVHHDPFKYESQWRSKIGVTVSGDVLLVWNRLNQIFKILKLNVEEGTWDKVDSLGGESWITDLGVTVPAIEETKPNSIYYTCSGNKFVYCGDVSTQSLERFPNFNTNFNFGYA
ncbi:hypothetical protein EUTSA_v10017659mg, partial [Eutrema salsugineum]